MAAHRALRTGTAALALAGLLLAACGDDSPEGSAGTTTTSGPAAEPVIDPGDGGHYTFDLTPAAFVDQVDNPYLPFADGAHWVYESEEDGETERIEVTVLPERKVVMGISATVVHDTVSVDGELIEDTYDWYAQDVDGNVWYLGEETAEYEDGEKTSTHGSWEAGVDGALPGIVMPADPQVGHAYRQEFYEGEALDMAEVIEVGATATVAGEEMTDLVVIREWNPLEPDTVENKTYAKGTGVVLEEKVQGGTGRAELVEYEPGS